MVKPTPQGWGEQVRGGGKVQVVHCGTYSTFCFLNTYFVIILPYLELFGTGRLVPSSLRPLCI